MTSGTAFAGHADSRAARSIGRPGLLGGDVAMPDPIGGRHFIEPTFGETRRWTKVIGRFPGEASYLTLV